MKAEKIRIGTLIFIILVLIYTINFKFIVSGDNIPARYIPFSLIKEVDFDLDEFYGHFLERYPYMIYGENLPYYVIKVKGHYLSSFGIGSGILAFPIFLFPILFFKLAPDSFAAVFLAKFAASLAIALSGVFIYLSLKIVTTQKNSLILTFVYALCSCVWSISSQQLWQHTSSELCIAIAIYFLLKGLSDQKFVSYTGFFLASAIIARPTNIVVTLILSSYVFFHCRKIILRFFFLAIIPLGFYIWYKAHYLGGLFIFEQLVYSPYSAMYKNGNPDLWSTPLSSGLAGLLFSPGRGLFFYSPVFILPFLGMLMIWKQTKYILFRYFAFSSLSLILIASKWYDWWGGWCFGYRPIVDAIPFLIFLFIPVIERCGSLKGFKIMFAILALFSFLVQIEGAFLYDNSWNGLYDIDLNRKYLWSWKYNPLSFYLNRAKF